MNPDQRNDLKQKFQSWKKKTPEERQRIRTQFEKFRKLPPEEKQRLRASRERFKNLAPERKQKLRERMSWLLRVIAPQVLGWLVNNHIQGVQPSLQIADLQIHLMG